ncbi:DUF523 domain-containing protein [Lachnospiraceae bacterium 62-35]
MEEKENVLISACLLGLCCRYDGEEKQYESIEALMKLCHLIPVCPEQLGGLKTPRDPAERRGNRVLTSKGEDVTNSYEKGAEEALKMARLFGCQKAILKEKSPSCGCGRIYDGSFSRKLIPGDGVTAGLFKSHGIEIVGERQVSEFAEQLKKKITTGN